MHRVKGNLLGVAVGLVSLTLLATPLAERAAAESRVTLRPATGLAGSQVHLVGRDLGKRDRVVVRAGNQVVARARTGRRGTFRASFAVPQLRPGKWRVITRSKGRRIVNVFRAVASASSARPVGEVASRRGRRVRWTPGEGSSGSALRLEGARFPPRRLVRIRFGGVSAGHARTGRRGRFSMHLTVPSLRAGRRLVRVKLRSRALGFMFTVTAGEAGTAEEAPERLRHLTGRHRRQYGRAGDRGGRRHRLRPRLHLLQQRSRRAQPLPPEVHIGSARERRPGGRAAARRHSVRLRQRDGVCPVIQPVVGTGEGDHAPRDRKPRVPHDRRHRLQLVGERRRLLRLLRRGGGGARQGLLQLRHRRLASDRAELELFVRELRLLVGHRCSGSGQTSRPTPRGARLGTGITPGSRPEPTLRAAAR